jgi:hypothetical protein
MLGEQALDERCIGHLALNEGHTIQRQGSTMAEDEIVENNDTLVLIEQVTNSVRAYVAGTAGDEKGSLGHVGNTAGVSDDAN